MANKNTNPSSGKDDNEMRILFGLILALCQNCAISHNPLFHAQNSNLFKLLSPMFPQPKERSPTWAKEIPIHGKGNVPVARKCINPPPSRNRTNAKNQAILKNNTIPQPNFYSSWGPSPVLLQRSF